MILFFRPRKNWRDCSLLCALDADIESMGQNSQITTFKDAKNRLESAPCRNTLSSQLWIARRQKSIFAQFVLQTLFVFTSTRMLPLSFLGLAIGQSLREALMLILSTSRSSRILR